MEQKRFDLRSFSPALRNLWLLLVYKYVRLKVISWQLLTPITNDTGNKKDFLVQSDQSSFSLTIHQKKKFKYLTLIIIWIKKLKAS